MSSKSKRSRKTTPRKTSYHSRTPKSKYKYRRIKKYGQSRKGPAKKGVYSRFTQNPKFKKTASKVLGITLGIFILLTIGGTLYLGVTLASISGSLPNPDELVDRSSAQSTKIYDKGGPDDGVLLYTIYGDQNREFVDLEKIPEHTKWAFLAAEDAEFYDHKGLDFPGLVRAAYGYVFKKSTSRGASTISQQLVKNTLLYDFLEEEAYEKTLTRKAKEMLITMQLEQSFSKDEILQMYLNEIALGGTNYGIQAASKAYYGKNASELTLAESAMLAGLIQAPGVYSPLFGTNPELAEDRQHYVLDQLYAKRDVINRTAEKNGEDFEVTEEMIDEAKEEEIAYSPARIDIKAPHFVFYVKQLLVEEYGIDRVERGGLTVTTTLDWDLQQIAEEEIRAGVDRYRAAHNVHNGSLVAIDPKTGQIQALVGSYDYWAEPDPRVDGNVNVSTSLRQMGSSVKPYTYLTAFNQGYSPALLTPDIPFDFGYKTRNWDDRYRGLMLARQALIESRNIPAMYTLQVVGGPDAFIKTAETLGITTLVNRELYGLSLTLGAGEMKLLEHTAAFGAFANGGVKHPTTPIIKVQTYDKEVLEEWSEEDSKRVWDEKEIYLLNWILCDLSSQGRMFGENYIVGDQRLCGKTGTTDGPRDLTTILYYPNLVVGIWTGNNNNEETIGVGGQGWSTTVPLPMAHSFMSRVIGKYGQAWYDRPAGIVTGVVCKDTGLRATEETECTKVSSIFIQGKLPPIDNSRVKKPICKSNGKIATNVAEAEELGLIEYKTFLSIKLPVEQHQGTLNGYLANSPAYGAMSQIPEEAECPIDVTPTISFTSPSSGTSTGAGSAVNLKVDVSPLSIIKNVEYSFDGTSIGKVTTSPFSKSYTIPAGTAPGSHTFSAKVTTTEGKTKSASVSISTTSPISIIDPTGGDITLPRDLTAEYDGSFAGVTVTISIVNISVNLPATSNGDGTFTVTWSGVAPGSYTIQASTNGGYVSNPITVEVNP